MVMNLCASIDMLILAALLIQSASTLCTNIGGNMTSCSTVGTSSTGPVVINPYQPGIMQSAVKPGKREKRAGEFILKGDCKGAEDYALKEGDFILVQSVRSYCRIKVLERNSPK